MSVAVADQRGRHPRQPARLARDAVRLFLAPAAPADPPPARRRRCCGSASSISARCFALLLQSFYSLDDFSGVIVHELTLKTYAELFKPQNFDIIVRTVVMAALVTIAAAIVAFPIAYVAARYARGKWKALFYLGVMLPLWSSYLVKVYAWKLILAKEGILNWVFEQLHLTPVLDAYLALPVIGGNSLLGQLHRHLPRLPLHLAALHDPADPGRRSSGCRRTCSTPPPTSAPPRCRPSGR